MTDLEFQDRAEALLQSVEAACDRINDNSDADIDNQRVGGMVTLVFANGSQIIVNLQKPLHEVWMAAREGGYHYQFTDEGLWRSGKEKTEFYSDLSRCASAQAGLALRF
jgi:CyaY protein